MNNITILKEGYPLIFGALAVTLLIGYLFGPIFAVLPALITAFITFFFREPYRPVEEDDSILYSPADGTVMAVDQFYDDEFLHAEAKKVMYGQSPTSPTIRQENFMKHIIRCLRNIIRKKREKKWILFNPTEVPVHRHALLWKDAMLMS